MGWQKIQQNYSYFFKQKLFLPRWKVPSLIWKTLVLIRKMFILSRKLRGSFLNSAEFDLKNVRFDVKVVYIERATHWVGRYGKLQPDFSKKEIAMSGLPTTSRARKKLNHFSVSNKFVTRHSYSQWLFVSFGKQATSSPTDFLRDFHMLKSSYRVYTFRASPPTTTPSRIHFWVLEFPFSACEGQVGLQTKDSATATFKGRYQKKTVAKTPQKFRR